MAKSEGKLLRLVSLIDEGYDPLCYRFFCLGAHYRRSLRFTWDALDAASSALNRLRRSVWEWGDPGLPDDGMMDRFRLAINNDLNAPQVLALAWETHGGTLEQATKKATLLEFDQVLGLGLAEWQPEIEQIPEHIEQLVAQRQKARQGRDWEEADALRSQIEGAGYEVKNMPEGAQVRLKVE